MNILEVANENNHKYRNLNEMDIQNHFPDLTKVYFLIKIEGISKH